MAVQKLQRCENTAFHFRSAPFGTQSHGEMTVDGEACRIRERKDPYPAPLADSDSKNVRMLHTRRGCERAF